MTHVGLSTDRCHSRSPTDGAGRDGFASAGSVAYECGVDELFEPDDESASDHEVMGHPHSQGLAGGPVPSCVAGEHDDVLTFDDVGVVMCGPVIPHQGQLLHHVG